MSFEPPRPPVETAWAKARTLAGGTAAVVAIAVLDVLTLGLVRLAAHVLGLVQTYRDGPPHSAYDPPPRVPEDLDRTAPPRRDADDRVACTRCGQAVPFETMALSEDGYFCGRCAAALA